MGDMPKALQNERQKKKQHSSSREACYQYFRDQFKAFPTDSAVLDVGSGRLRYCEFIPQFTHVTTLDNQPFEGIMVVHDIAKPLPFTDGMFDIVLLSNTLEHVENPPKLLAECRRVLKPGGAIIGAIPFMTRIHQAPRDFQRYTSHGLTYQLERAGFLDTSVEALGKAADTYVTMQRVFFEDLERDAHLRHAIVRKALIKACIYAHRLLRVLFAGLFSTLPASPAYTEIYGFTGRKSS